MENLKYFYLVNCPFCKKAQKYMDELMAEDPRYQTITIERIDERKEADLANQYDYYLVPTFYLKDKKLFEGIMSKEDVKQVLEAALQQ